MTLVSIPFLIICSIADLRITREETFPLILAFIAMEDMDLFIDSLDNFLSLHSTVREGRQRLDS
jgi:hypothetical protein